MKERLEKKLKKPMNWDEAFEEMIKMIETRGQRRRGKIGSAVTAGEEKSQLHIAAIATGKLQKLTKPANRYIPASIRHEVTNRNQGICHFPSCTKPGKIFHHLNRFALDPRHQSETIVSLCKPHEQIAHHTLIQDETMPSENWQVAITPNRDSPTNTAKYSIDRLVQKYRRITH